MNQDKLRYIYFAKGKYPRFRHPSVGDVPLPGKPSDDSFMVRYGELVARVRQAATNDGGEDDLSFRWLAAQWQRSKEFGALRAPSQHTYAESIKVAMGPLGDQPYSLITRKMVKAVRNDLSATPRKAQKMKEAVSSLYSWAAEEELVPDDFNPAKGFKRLKWRVAHHIPWSDEELGMVLSYAQPNLKTLLMLSVYTGQRSTDVVGTTWSQVLGGRFSVSQSKTGADLLIPVHSRLQAHLNALRSEVDDPTGVIVRNQYGRAFHVRDYRKMLRETIKLIPNMPKRTPHGLRYTAAAMLEEASCTVAQIVAILGHNTYKMALQYITQRRNAESALKRWEGHQGEAD